VLPPKPLLVLIEDVTGAGVAGWTGVANPEGPPWYRPCERC